MCTRRNGPEAGEAVMEGAEKTIHRIAVLSGVERDFVEQVCRIYVTHPGVDAEGIVNKMEVRAMSERGWRN